jgi:citronellol/citronellal dehydrogenase
MKPYHIGVNAIWPKTTIATAAVQNLLGGDAMIRQSRWPGIVADAAAIILSFDPAKVTGRFFIDEEVLRETGIQDFQKYAVDPSAELAPDLFIEL